MAARWPDKGIPPNRTGGVNHQVRDAVDLRDGGHFQVRHEFGRSVAAGRFEHFIGNGMIPADILDALWVALVIAGLGTMAYGGLRLLGIAVAAKRARLVEQGNDDG